MVDQGTKTQDMSGLRAAELARAFRNTPELWIGTLPSQLGDTRLTNEDVSALRKTSRFTTALYASKFEFLLNNGWDDAGSSGLVNAVSNRYLSNDPASWTIGSEPELTNGLTQPNLAGELGNYAFFEFEDMPTLALNEDGLRSEDVREQVERRRTESLFQAEAVARLTQRSRAQDQPIKRRPVTAATTAHYPAVLGRAGTTFTPAALRNTRVHTQRSRERVQQLAMAGSRGNAIQGLWLPSSASALGNDSEGVPTSTHVLLDDLAVSKQHLPTLTSAVEIAQAAFGAPNMKPHESSSGSSRLLPRISGVFSPDRIERALKVVTLDPIHQASRSLGSEVNAVPGYHRLIYDAAEQSWLAIEPGEYDTAMSGPSLPSSGKRLSSQAAQAFQIAEALPPNASVRTISSLANPQLDPVDASPVVAPIYENADLAAALARQVARHASRTSVIEAKTLKRAHAATSTGAASLDTLVPAVHHNARSNAEDARRNYEAWLRGEGGRVQGRSSTAIEQNQIRGIGGATTNRPELFVSQLMLRRQRNDSSLLGKHDGATSIAGEVGYQTTSWGGAYDDPTVYVSLESNTYAGPALRTAMGQNASHSHHIVSMPLSSLAQLQNATTRLQATPGDDSERYSNTVGPYGDKVVFRGLARRDGATINRESAQALLQRTEGLADEIRHGRRSLTTAPLDLPALAKAGLETSGHYHYEMSYGLDAVLLDRSVDIFGAGGHVEVRDGRILQARPATPAASYPNRPASPEKVHQALTQRTLLPASRRLHDLRSHELTEDAAQNGNIVSASRRAISQGRSAIERGYPALSLSPGTSQQSETRIDTLSVPGAALLAGSHEAALSLMPSLAHNTMQRGLDGVANMTSGGVGTGGLLTRLAQLADPTDASSRQQLFRELSVLGVDTPELLRAVEDGTRRPSDNASFMRRSMETYAAATVQPDQSLESGSGPSLISSQQLKLSERIESEMSRVAEALIGVGGSAASENVILRHDYFGDFAPAVLHRTTAPDLLQHLLGLKPAQRTSSLAFGAELGELMTLGPNGVGSRNLARAVATGKRKASAGAPSQAKRIHQSTNASRRRLERLKNEEAAIAGRLQSEATRNRNSNRTISEASTSETFANRVAQSVASTLQPPNTMSATSDVMSWDGDTMTLAANADISLDNAFDIQSRLTRGGLSERVNQSLQPWDAIPTTSTSTLSHGGIRSLGYDSDAHPLVAGLREPDTPGPSSVEPLGNSQIRELPALAKALHDASDGVRGFKSIGHTAVRNELQRLIMQRMPAGSLPGNLELAHSVLDRANGAFAGLDAGILRFLRSTAARGADTETRELRPGLDEWPDDSLEILQQHGWGLDGSSSSGSPAGNEPRIQRLERRVNAAQDAYARLAQARQQVQTASPRSLDSVDWNLVQTGAARDTPMSADLGRLGTTMVRSQTVPEADMSYVAPAVKMVAQQAQLKPTHEPMRTTHSAPANTPGIKKKKKAQKVDIEALARQIAGRITRRNELQRDRFGRS